MKNLTISALAASALLFVASATRSEALDASPPPENITLEWTIKQINAVTIPSIQINDTEISDLLRLFGTSMSFPGYYIDIDVSAVKHLLGRKLSIEEKNLPWIELFARMADTVEADILIKPGSISLIPRQENQEKEKSVEAQMKSRKILACESGEHQLLAQNLLKAIEQNSHDLIKKYMGEIVAHGEYRLIIPLLSDPSEIIKQEAARSLSEIKTKEVAQAYIDALPALELGIRGGDQALILRNETKKAFQKALSKITGIQVKESWSEEQTWQHFEEAIPNLPK